MTSSSMPIALVTGANRGLGREAVRRLADRGWTVWLGARDLDAGKQAAETVPGDVRPVQLDVTDDASVAAAVETVARESTRLDVLVNNAGIGGTRSAPPDTTPADFLPVFGVNLLGPVRVTGAFLPLLRRSANPRLVMVSSGMGSFGVTTDSARLESSLVGLVYPSSKTALNMVTSMYAKSLPDVRVTAVDPGYTSTAFNGFQGTQSVEEGAEVIVQACVDDALAGPFIDRHGALPW